MSQIEQKISDDITAMQARVDNITRSMRRIEEFTKRFDAEKDSGQVSVRLARLDELFEHYGETVLKLQLLSPVSKKEYEGLLDDAEERFYRCKSILTNVLPKQPATNQSRSNQTVTQINHVKYPELKLPEFSGKLADWKSFHDSFDAAVNSCAQLSAVQKFQYLKSTLKGEALRLIDPLAVSSENYPLAWKTLVNRYNNKRLLIKCHIKALFDTPAMRRESPESLLELVDSFERNISILKRLGEPADRWSSILVYQLSLRLDNRTLREWEHHASRDTAREDGAINDGMPSYVCMIQFLQDYARVLQSLSPVSQISQQTSYRTVETKTKMKSSVYHAAEFSSSSSPSCHSCGQNHYLANCPKFRRLSPRERLDFAKGHRLCLNCLRTSSHICMNCPSSNCRKCERKHHTLLHLPPLESSHTDQQTSHLPIVANLNQPGPPPVLPSTQVRQSALCPTVNQTAHFANSGNDIGVSSNLSESLAAHSNCGSDLVLLWTALVNFEDMSGKIHPVRILLDCGSQCNFISESLRQKLSLDTVVSRVDVAGIGSSIAKVERSSVAVVSSRVAPYRKKLAFLVLPAITRALPHKTVSCIDWNIPNYVYLADPTFNIPGPIDAIIGNECFAEILRYGKINLENNNPVLQKTLFGWVVFGKCKEDINPISDHSYHISRLDSLERLVTKFWEMESCSSVDNWSPSEQECENHFKQNTTRDDRGRYVVKLPKRLELISQLRDNKYNAQRRFLALERKLEANLELKTMYHEFIHEYISMGHMREISAENDQSPQYFLPHHAVLRPESSTTKLRTVFDASCKSQSGMSLNDVLLTGPTIQQSLIALVMRFCMHAYVVTADIAKMYRQIMVHPTDQPLQRIYWRDDKNTTLKIFQLQTVTYGTNSASFLATRVLKQLAEDEKVKFPLAAPVIRSDFYMDDLLTGCEDLNKLKETCSQLVSMLDSAGFQLRKFSSNSQDVLNMIPEHLRESKTILEFESGSSIKTLGLLWEPASDFISYNVPDWSPIERYTKRIMLSRMSRLFDPLGLLGPLVVTAKITMQLVWKEQIPWDSTLPPVIRQMWEEYQVQVAQIRNIRIPRFVLSLCKNSALQMHGFCDASMQAYGACIYVRSIAPDEYCTVRLIATKSRVAPLEVKSIARLELCAALLLSQLTNTVLDSIGRVQEIFLWTDSTIVLHWLAATPSTWQTFVANRVAEIQRLTPNVVWRHVPSLENPADLLSRGMISKDLMDSSLWWNGPEWLATTNHLWPDNIRPSQQVADQFLESRKISLHSSCSPSELIEQYSSLTKLLRIASLCRRFAHNSGSGNVRRLGPLTKLEIRQTLLSLIRLVQEQHFSAEISALAAGRSVSRSSRLRYLHPMLQNGLIQVGGRLHFAKISPDRKFPFVLPDKNPLTSLIADTIHQQTLHGGSQLLLSTIRHEFWPLGGRNLARKTVHNCVTCAKAKPRTIEQLMGQLPPERVSPAYPFQFVGIDYAGPIYLRPNTRKGAPIKAYVAVFVCLVVKASHLELVTDLTSAAFIAALRRFIARRGVPTTVYCDNATNFTAAQRELKELRQQFLSQKHKEAVHNEASTLKIEFHFIPPHAPTFGGLWEACVKSFKHHLRRIVGNSLLSAEAVSTVLAQIEGVLNSRPITPLSSDPSDLQALTPGHFLIGRPILTLPEPDLSEIPTSRLDMWQKMQLLTQHFWRRWQDEYLSTLQTRYRWTTVNQNLLIGSIVLIRDDNKPIGKWSMGRVTDVHPGEDGLVRVATLRIPSGKLIKRPITKICRLPVEVDAVTVAERPQSTTEPPAQTV
ncbi:uncharacterized protein LOC129766204 [Toxorhynchites rutilus septentrionalis]|uniref:uncharacterized protein LOC129766204 n=1 Tax=Toxorhynchites rutilus septentrionalis TaxID=329112 RepID=UPI00247A56CF|nr:uncharacterized protein LOC129766204 [Toxorhynchites rutilus septentrionalis]